ncbi:hypothetical protein BD410DRAFT_845043 [Rickenella mellea]|uniref:Ribonuclease H1 N-terminal domain-containing protein n=1 Tax=Rickenella mellea TaxID=50990 RepID=A0A4Y7PM23_9AGAM|nr:hypothetical protein BD410DRAFT_845043 [Rickenella mellea]
MHSPVKDSPRMTLTPGAFAPPALGKTPPVHKGGKYLVYAVFAGYQIGFVYDADLAKSFTEHFKDLRYKGFKTLQEAHNAWNEYFAKEPRIPTILHYHSPKMGPSTHAPDWATNGATSAAVPLSYFLARAPPAEIAGDVTTANVVKEEDNAVEAPGDKDGASTGAPGDTPPPQAAPPAAEDDAPEEVGLGPAYAVIRGVLPGVYLK